MYLGRKEIVQRLLQMGANVNYVNKNNNTPLILASQNGNFENEIAIR